MSEKVLRGWKRVRIKEIGKVITGTTPSKNNPEHWGNEILFITPSDYKDYNKWSHNSERKLSVIGKEKLRKKLLPPKSVMVTCIGSDMGKVAITPFPVITNQQINSIIVDEKKAYYNFIYYFLKDRSEELKLLGHSGGSALPILNKSTFENLEITIPESLDEQRAIAGVLSSLDDKIDLLHRQNKTLEAMAETLFRKWFIEEAKEDWEEGVLGDEFDFIMGQSPPGSSYNEKKQGIPLFQGNADFGFRFPKNRIFTTEPKKTAKKYDTLISVRAPVGEQNMAFEECCIGRGVAALRYKHNETFYTYTYFKIKSLMKKIKQYNETGTVFGSITKNDLETLETIIPSSTDVEKFQETVKPIDDKIIQNCIQIRTLENLRDTLLPKLMSGEVRVRV